MRNGLLLLLLLLPLHIGAAPFWASCDEKWKEAWEECDEDNGNCYYLGKKYRPSCKPKDYHLKKYRNGQQGYFEEAQTQAKARQNRAELVQIDSYVYGSSYSGDSLYINAKIKNLNSNGKVVLSKAELSCSIIANEAYRIFNGRVYMFPNLISGGQGEISMYFLPGDFTNRYFQKNGTYQHTEDDRYISLSNVRNQVKSLAISCDVVNAWFGF